MSDVEDLKGTISIARPSPISRGPITYAPPSALIILYAIAALCWPGITKTFAFPTISENGYNSE